MWLDPSQHSFNAGVDSWFLHRSTLVSEADYPNELPSSATCQALERSTGVALARILSTCRVSGAHHRWLMECTAIPVRASADVVRNQTYHHLPQSGSSSVPYSNGNKCNGDDTKGTARRSPNCILWKQKNAFCGTRVRYVERGYLSYNRNSVKKNCFPTQNITEIGQSAAELWPAITDDWTDVRVREMSTLPTLFLEYIWDFFTFLILSALHTVYRQ